MRGRWVIGVAATALAVLVAIWVTSTPRVEFVQSRESPVDDTGATRDPVEIIEDQADSSRGGVAQHDSEIPDWVWVVASVFLALLFIALAAVVVRLQVRQRRRRDEARELAHTLAPERTETGYHDAAEQLADAAADQRAALLTGKPRNAIVACWLALEDAAESGGVRRRPSETALEFTQRVIARHVVDESALERLADLYREARFSDHTLTEAHRLAAVAALDRLAEQLADRQPTSGLPA